MFNGKWVGDKRNGKGEEISANGAKHVGLWVDDLKEGSGTWISQNGLERMEGTWKGGEFVGEVEEKKD